MSLARGDEVPHISTRKPHLRPSENLTLSAKRLLQQYRSHNGHRQTGPVGPFRAITGFPCAAAKRCHSITSSARTITEAGTVTPSALAVLRLMLTWSRSGNVWDNAAMESFFSSLKTERTARKMYRTRDDAKADVFDYIERFYNPKRRHSTIGYLSPMEFERQAGLA